MRKLIIVGAGGHAREVHQLVVDINAVTYTWEVIGFLVEEGFGAAGTLCDRPLMVGIGAFREQADACAVIAIGSATARARLVRAIRRERNCEFATLVHPSVWLASHVSIGEGTQIFPGSIVNTDVTIGSHVIVNSGSNISHDTIVDDYATLGPRVTLCGWVRIGRGVELGASSTVTPRCSIGADALVGAGGVVVRDVAPGITVVGVPARPHCPTAR